VLAGLLLLGLPVLVMSVPAFHPPAYADQRDPRLPKLFEALQQAHSAGEAITLEAVIWSIWAESGNRDLDRLLQAGSLAMTQDDYDTALKDFNELIKRAPNFAEGWNKRATVNYLLGNYQASLADIDRTLELEPRHFGALAGLGMVNLELDRDEAALDAFQRVLKIDPMNPAARINVETIKQRIKEKSI